MQIIEVRNDILKLAYSPFQNGLLLSDFLLVTEGSKSILAQVIGIESSQEKDINIAVLKGCLSVDDTGKINSYVGFTPSTGAEVTPVSQEQVISMLCEQNVPAVEWGYLAQHDNVLFKTEKNILENKPLILMDDYANYNVIANNLVYSNSKLGKKTVLVDFDGSLKIDNAFYVTPGEDFKLPLSYTTLNYIYETELKEESLSTQAVVQDIIIELQEYIKTLPEGFLPFSTIKNVIYSQYEENKIPELMLFKNKFVKYAQQGIFAETASDFDYLNQAIKENDIVVIDVTCVEFVWHRLILNYLAKNMKEDCLFIAKLEDDNSDKKTILDIYNNHNINPVLVSCYSHPFVNVMKSIAKNMILFPPIKLLNDFAIYSSFVQKLNRDEYVICGEDTLYLSFMVRLTYINSNMAPDYIEEQIQRDVDKLYRAGAKSYTTSQVQTSQELEYKYTQNSPDIDYPAEDITTEEDLDFLDEMDSYDEMSENISKEETQNIDSDVDENSFDETDLDMLEMVDSVEEMNIESDVDFDKQISDEQIETEEIIEDEGQTFDFNEEEQNQIDDEPFENENIETIEESPEADEINEIYEVEEIQHDEEYDVQNLDDENIEENIIENINDTEDADDIEEDDSNNEYLSQPIPVYSVPELDNETEPEFTEGNMVYHEKYGRGVIEKIMNYGNKTLCSIQFEEVGRRLLDPNLAGLKQI